jgi:hypothetical protein
VYKPLCKGFVLVDFLPVISSHGNFTQKINTMNETANPVQENVSESKTDLDELKELIQKKKVQNKALKKIIEKLNPPKNNKK